MAAPGLERHRLALLAAREDVGNPRAGTDWAVFGYEKHHELKLLDSGAGGPDELAGKFSAGSVMYGLCRVPEPGTGAPRVVLISWVGEEVPEAQREACAAHLPVLRGFFREARAVLSARRPEEVTREGLSRALAHVEPPGAPPSRRVPPPDAEELVGTNYRRTNPALELRRTQRDSFWAQAEREEQQRREEERRRALEEQQRWERLRRLQERREAAERERRCQDRERELREQRKAQALLEAEERRKEKERWEQQQREHEEALWDHGRSSESVGKAAEAALLASQRPQNPRDFFLHRERSGSASGAPGPPRPGPPRPFLRYQRSLTEAAFIFRRAEPPPPAAPQPRERPPGPGGTGSAPEPPNGRTGTPPSPGGAGPPHATIPVGTGTPPSATIGTPTMGTGTPPSPIGTGTPPSAIPGTPPSATIGTPTMGTGTPPGAIPEIPPPPYRHRDPPEPYRDRDPPKCHLRDPPPAL
ncbi:drebrin-like [Amazona ochrocephala]